MLNYREKYKKHYGIDFPSHYVIHHIDGNHHNDDICNLILLPNFLHSYYHQWIYPLESIGNCESPFKEKTKAVPYLVTCYSQENEYLECLKWRDFKMYLDGKIPNIHKITLKED